MTASALPSSEIGNSLSNALVLSSRTPILLLDGGLTIQGASHSFCSAFQLDPAQMTGARLAELGEGEWSTRQLDTLLKATVDGNATIDGYQMELVRRGSPVQTRSRSGFRYRREAAG